MRNPRFNASVRGLAAAARMRFSLTPTLSRWERGFCKGLRGRPAGDQVVVRYALVTSMISSSGMSSNEA